MARVPHPSLPGSFVRLSASNLFAQSAEQIALAAAPLAAVLLLGAGAAETGWLQTAQTLPFLLLSIPAGIAADRVSRRRLLLGSEALRSLSLLATVILLGAGLLDLPLLGVLGFLGAVGTVCFTVTAPAIVPTLVSRDQLGGANRWIELGRSAAFVAGPAVGGALVSWTGVPVAFVAATGLSVLVIGLLMRLPDSVPEPSHRDANVLRDLAQGCSFVIRSRWLRPVFVTALFFNIGWFAIQGVFVAYAVHELAMSGAQVGLTLGIYGVGMIVGAAVTPWLSARLPFGLMIVLGPICGTIAALLMLSTVVVGSVAIASLSYFLFGFGPIMWTITTTTLRQAVTPNGLLGRVSALITTATFGARPVGAALGAFLAAQISMTATLMAAFLCFVIQCAVIVASRVSRLRGIPAEEDTTGTREDASSSRGGGNVGNSSDPSSGPI
ncbi:MAG: MFS transporter [Brevibacterium sp.]